MADSRNRKKYDLGAAVDKELVFDFPYILHEDTVNYIQEHGKIMFIIRGPPSTGKATLSEMICDKYSDATFCCADSYFKNSFASPVRNRDTLRASHAYCSNKAESACKKKANIIVVQNTHMKKWEMQPYLNLAAFYNYTVIMAITLYRFDVTPEALVANSPDGLDITYFRRRLSHWEDVPPLLTGWFLCPNDALYLQTAAVESLKKLTGDGKFCRIFNIYDSDEIVKYFEVRNLSYCLAGYSTDSFAMRKYYLKPDVQDVYGKCFKITILGYHVTCSNMSAVVLVDDEMKPLMFENEKSFDLSDHMSSLDISGNLFEFSKTSQFSPDNSVESFTACMEDWNEGEEIDVLKCSFIHLAQRDKDIADTGKIRKEFKKSMYSAANNGKINNASYTELENETKICRIQEKEWLIKANKKIVIKTIFTGLYP